MFWNFDRNQNNYDSIKYIACTNVDMIMTKINFDDNNTTCNYSCLTITATLNKAKVL